MTNLKITYRNDLTSETNTYTTDITDLSPKGGFTQEWLNDYLYASWQNIAERICERHDVFSCTYIDSVLVTA